MKRIALLLSITALLDSLSGVAFAKPGRTFRTSSTLSVKARTVEGKLRLPKGHPSANR